MPNNYDIQYKDLTQHQVNEVWNFLQTTALRAVLQHRFDTKIAEAQTKFEHLSATEFEAHKGSGKYPKSSVKSGTERDSNVAVSGGMPKKKSIEQINSANSPRSQGKAPGAVRV